METPWPSFGRTASPSAGNQPTQLTSRLDIYDTNRFMRNLYSDELQNDHDQKHPSRKYKFKDSPAEICRCDKPDYPGGMLKHEPNCFAKVLLLALADGPAEKSWSKLSATTDRMLTKVPNPARFHAPRPANRSVTSRPRKSSVSMRRAKRPSKDET